MLWLKHIWAEFHAYVSPGLVNEMTSKPEGIHTKLEGSKINLSFHWKQEQKTHYCNFFRSWFLVMWLWQAFLRQNNDGVVEKHNKTAAVELYTLSLVRVNILLVWGHLVDQLSWR